MATIAALLALVVAMVLIGYRHFGNIQAGVAAASLFLLLPYTDQMVGRIDHIVPAALLVGAVAAYRRPLPAGLLLGTAGGLTFYPLLLFPLWCSFYWRRGLTRYLIGIATSLGVMIGLLVFLHPPDTSVDHWFVDQLRQMFGLTIFEQETSSGFWRDLELGRADSSAGGVWRVLCEPGLVACPQESGHAVELLGRRDAGGPVLSGA